MKILGGQTLGQTTTRSSSDLWLPMLLVFVGVLFFGDFLFTSKNFFFRDILQFHYPLRKVLMDSFARGEFPLWNPYVYLGQPMLANPNYMAFYPTNVLNALFSFNYAFKLHFILHPLAGGLGMYFLQRRLGIDPLAAMTGSLAYQFSGVALSFLNLYNVVPAVGLLPWIGWAFVVAVREAAWRHDLLFGAIFSLQIIAVEPIMLQCAIGLLIALLSFECLETRKPLETLRKALRAGAIGTGFGLSLAAVQLLPALELLPRSIRGSGYDFDASSEWSMHPADLLNLIIPNLFGYPYTINRTMYWGEIFHSGREGYLVSFFLGAGTILFALASFASRRKKLQRVILAMTLVGVFLALGRYNPAYQWLYDHVFVFRLERYPSKYFLLGTIGLAFLASLGMESILRQRESSAGRNRFIVAAGLIGLILSAFFLGAWFHWKGGPQELEDWIRAQVQPNLVIKKDFVVIRDQALASLRWPGIFFFLFGIFLIASRFWNRTAIVGSMLLVLLVAELVPENLRVSPLISEADVDFVAEVTSYLQKMQDTEPSRVVALDSPLHLPIQEFRAPNRSAAWFTLLYQRAGQPFYAIPNGIQYSVYYSIDDLNTRESQKLLESFHGLAGPAALTLLQKTNSPFLLTMGEILDPRVERLSSFDTHTDRRLNLYRLKESLPRAYFASGRKNATSPEDALQKFIDPEFPFKKKVILENVGVPEDPDESSGGAARILEYRGSRVALEVEAPVPGHLVLLDSYFPGWKAYLDGKEVEILRANYAFRAVAIPRGRHQVEFLYRPASFYIGLLISSLALLTGSLTLLFVILKPR